MRGYSQDTQAVRTHRYVRESRADDAYVAGAAGDTHEPAAVRSGLHTTRRATLAAEPTRYPPVRCEYRAPRWYAGRVLRVLAAHAVRHCAALALRSSRTGDTVRGYSQDTQAVRTHRYVREGRADNADVAGAAIGDTHKPAGEGLHTTRRATLAAAPTKRTRRSPTAL